MGFEYATVRTGVCGSFHFQHQHDNYNHTHCENRVCDSIAADHHHNFFASQPILFDHAEYGAAASDQYNGYGDNSYHQPALTGYYDNTLDHYVTGYTDELNDPAYD